MSKKQFGARARGRFLVKGLEHGMAPAVAEEAERLNATFEQLASDRNLSETGRKSKFTESVKLPLFNVQSRRKAIRDRMKQIESEREKIVRERRPVAATEEEKNTARRLWDKAESLEERGLSDRAARIRKIFEGHDVESDPESYRLVVAFQALHPGEVGPLGEQLQQLARVRLGLDDAGPKGRELEIEAAELSDEDAQLTELRAQVVKAADRAALVKSGFIPRKTGEWTQEERAEYVTKNGLDAFMELLNDEKREAFAASDVPPQYESLFDVEEEPAKPENGEAGPPLDGQPAPIAPVSPAPAAAA